MAKADDRPLDGRVPLALRAGVIGHRWLLPEDPSVVGAVHAALTRLEAAVPSATPVTRTELVVVSSLADGADRIVAQAAIDRGARLEVVLPAPVDVYRQVFSAGSVEEFDRLMALAATVVVMSDHLDDDAYAAAGRGVVERADVLVSFWDGQPARGPGGTAESQAYAVRNGRAVWWFEVREGAAAVVEDHGAPRLPPVLGVEARRGLDGFNARSFARGAGGHSLVAAVFARADVGALRSQRRLRRTTQLNYALAVVAVALLAAQLTFQPRVPWLPALELVALATIASLLVSVRRGRLLELWTSSRYLAERLRATRAFVDAGLRPEAAGEWTELVDDEDVEWASRALLEVTRRLSSGAPAPELDTVKQVLARTWLRAQIEYHLHVSRRYSQFDRIAFASTLGLFIASVAGALAHLTIELLGVELEPDWLAFIALIVPAAAAALGAYAAQREFKRHAARSASVARRLIELEQRVARSSSISEVRSAAAAADRLVAAEAGDWFAVAQFREPELP